MTPTRRWSMAVAVVVLAAGVYLPGIPGDFVYDDFRLIVRNDGLKRPFDPRRAFLRDYYASDFDRMGLGYYRPFAILSNEADYRGGGGRPLRFHLTNLGIHAACTALVIALARRLAPGRDAAALGAGLLFALHPAHAESVAFISGRVDPLATLFGLMALLAHLRGGERDASRAWPAAAAAAWLGALFSKEMAVTVPAAALLLDAGRAGEPPWRAPRRELVRRYAPYAVAAVIYLALRVTALGALASAAPAAAAWSAVRPLVTLGSYVAWLMLPPHGLHLEPELASGFAAIVYAGVGVIAIGGVLALWRRGARVEGALLAAALVALLPVAQLRPLETSLSERFLYLPSAFVAILIARSLLGGPLARAGVAAFVALAVLDVAVLAPRVVAWRDEVRLWTRQVREAPGSIRAWVNLAHAHARRGETEEARRVYERAASLGLDRRLLAAEMTSALGAASPEEEERVLLEGLEAAPRDGALWQNLGFVRLGRGDADGAAEAFSRAVDIVPARAVGWLGLAFAQLRRGDLEAALEASGRAATLDPSLSVARAVHGESLWRLGRPCEAVAALDGLVLDEAEESQAAARVLDAARRDCDAVPK